MIIKFHTYIHMYIHNDYYTCTCTYCDCVYYHNYYFTENASSFVTTVVYSIKTNIRHAFINMSSSFRFCCLLEWVNTV